MQPAKSSSGSTATGDHRILLVQAGSLVATAWMVWIGSLVPRLHHQTAGAIVGHALEYAILAWLWSAVIAFGLYSIVPFEAPGDMLRNVLRTAATAVWFGPAMILLSEFSPAALLAALVLAVHTSRLLYSQWRELQPAPAEAGPVAPREPGSFAECQLPRPFVFRELAPGLAISFCLQAGVLAVALHYPLLGAGWLCLATAMLTVFSIASGAAGAGRPPSLPRSLLGVLATVVLAVMLTVAGAPGHFMGGSGGFGDRFGASQPGLLESARILLRQLFYEEAPSVPGGTLAKGGVPAPQPVDAGPPGGFPGVILWPEIKSVITLVAPLPAGSAGLFSGPAPKPLGIPFSGEYWMFRWPYARPPQKSYFQRGTPTKMTFSTTDHTPLQMEAHHKLDIPIAVDCCGKIQIEIVNADRYPGTMWLELILLDNELPRTPWLPLGSRPVTSVPDLKRDPILAVRETLDFPLPAIHSLDQFNEFKVIFHRHGPGMDKSAKISVERFVLVPRGN